MLWKRARARPEPRKEQETRLFATGNSQRARGTKRFVKRFVKGAGVIVAILAASYWIGANLFLALGFSKLFDSTNQVNATFRLAWTIWPGTLHLRDLRVTFQDKNLQFALDLPEGVVDVRLWDLMARTFRATRLEGSGLRFRMRHRIQPEVKGEPWVSKLPPIAEFRDPPLFEAWVPEPPIPEHEYDLWTVHLENVQVETREVWAQFVRFRGEAVARGSFRLRPARNLWVGPATLDLRSGTLSLGDLLLAGSVRGQVECTVHPFDVRVPQGMAVFRQISARLLLDAGQVRLDSTRILLPESAPTIRAAPGRLQVSASLDRGRFKHDSYAELSTSELVVEDEQRIARLLGLLIRAQGILPDWGEVVAHLDSASLTLRQKPHEPITIGTVQGRASSSSRDVTQAWQLRAAELEVAEAKIADLMLLNAALSLPDPKLTGGLRLDFRARYTDGLFDGHAKVKLADARAEWNAMAARFNGQLLLELSDARPVALSGKLLAELRGESVELSSGVTAVRAQGVALSAQLHAEQGLMRGELSGALDAVSARAGSARLRAAASTDGALEALDLRTLEGRGHAEVRFSNTRVERGPMRLTADELRLRSSLDRTLEGAWSAKLQGDIGGLSGNWFVSSDKAPPDRCFASRIRRAHLKGALGWDDANRHLVVNAGVTGATVDWDDFHASFDATLRARGSAPRGGSTPQLFFTLNPRDVRLKSGLNPEHGWETELEELQLEGALASGHRFNGSLKLDTEAASVRVGRTQLRTDLATEVRVDSFDPDRKEGWFQGGVRLSRTLVRVDDHQIDDWWAEVRLDSGRFSAADNLDLSAIFRAKMRDAAPGLAVLSAEDQLPGWLVTVLPLRELAAKGTINRRCRLTDIRVTSAQGGPLVARGRLLSESEGARGAVLVRLANLEAVSAGIGFGPSNTEVALLASHDWLESRFEHFNAIALEAVQAPCPPAADACQASSTKAAQAKAPAEGDPAKAIAAR